jgi:hypothetical protein
MNLDIPNKKIITSLLIFFISIINLLSQEDNIEIIIFKKKIDTAYYSFDSHLLKRLLNHSEKLKNKFPNNWYPDYYAGIICLQLGKILYIPQPDKAYHYFDSSVAHFLNVKNKIYNAEIAALLSAAYGKKSSLSTLKSIYFGLKARDYIYEANKMEPVNHKVFLVAATHLMHTPETFGGNKELAEKLLKKSLKLIYQHNLKNEYSVNWANEAEIYAYLAQLEILQNNRIKARLYIDKALKLVPDYGFVLYDLIPQMKKIKN